MRKIGYVKAAHGIKGELLVIFYSGDYSWSSKIKNLSIENTIYKISSMRSTAKGLLVRLVGVEDRNAAEELQGTEVSVDAKVFVSLPGEQLYLTEIENFFIEDMSFGKVGRIVSFSSNGVQDLLVVEREETNEKCEIPFIQEFISHIDFENQIVIMKLPEGLLEVNSKS